MTFVKRGCVMVENVCNHTPVLVPSSTPCVGNANVEFGNMVEEFSSVLSVPLFYARMTNLSTKRRAKYWMLRATSANLATNLDNIPV